MISLSPSQIRPILFLRRRSARSPGTVLTHATSARFLFYSAFLLILALCPGDTAGAVINATSPSFEDVSLAVAQAQTGDTVVVPAGTAVWTQGLGIVEKGITLQGAGQYVYTGSPTLENSTGRETIIINEIPTHAALIAVLWTNPVGMFRLTGFQFKGGTTSANYTGAIVISGSINKSGRDNSKWRIDHCYFNRLNGRPGIYAFSGLIDNCYFDQGQESGILFDGRIPDASEKGHWSWATDVRIGTVDEGVYVENCYFTSDSLRACTDGYAGSRFVFRYNRVDNAAVENHGTDSTQEFRGGRWMAVYGNALNSSISGEYATHFRSGSGVIFSNTVTGKFPGIFRGLNYRLFDSFPPYGGASGENVWDDNAPGFFGSGTHNGVDNSRLVLTDSTQTWQSNQWRGFSLVNKDSGRFGLIIGNTATSITVADSQYSNPLIWSKGNRYEICKIVHVLDGVGMGKGDLLEGGKGSPIAVNPTPVGWPHQVDDPIYIWANTGNTAMAGDPLTIEGRNYIYAVRKDYIPLEFPHPFAALSSGDAAPSSPGTATAPLAPHNLRVLSSP